MGQQTKEDILKQLEENNKNCIQPANTTPSEPINIEMMQEALKKIEKVERPINRIVVKDRDVFCQRMKIKRMENFTSLGLMFGVSLESSDSLDDRKIAYYRDDELVRVEEY